VATPRRLLHRPQGRRRGLHLALRLQLPHLLRHRSDGILDEITTITLCWKIFAQFYTTNRCTPLFWHHPCLWTPVERDGVAGFWQFLYHISAAYLAFMRPAYFRCLEMFGCLQAERTIAIRERKFLNKFCVIHNALCKVFVATAKTELESC